MFSDGPEVACLIPQEISHYRIIERLGAGGMGEVFLAQDVRLDRKVAIKMLSDTLAGSHQARQRLINEAKAAAGGVLPGAAAFKGDRAMELLLRNLLPKMEELTARRLYPTYAYFRVYRHGDILKRHKDREACEFSLTVCLGYEGASVWPIFIEGAKGVFGAKLAPGDALLYKGIDCDHWREPFDGLSASQVFLHYVDQDGPYKEWRFDKRPDLSIAMD